MCCEHWVLCKTGKSQTCTPKTIHYVLIKKNKIGGKKENDWPKNTSNYMLRRIMVVYSMDCSVFLHFMDHCSNVDLSYLIYGVQLNINAKVLIPFISFPSQIHSSFKEFFNFCFVPTVLCPLVGGENIPLSLCFLIYSIYME